MNPIEIASIAASLLALGLSVGAMLRKKNHVHDDLRKQLDEALAENERMARENARLADELHQVRLKVTPEVAQQFAKLAVDYAEQLGGTSEEKLRHAYSCFVKLDEGDNGQRDWSDKDIRIFIEAELANR